MPGHRVAWVDTFRGLAIILVVLAHCGRGLDKAGIAPGFQHGAVDDWIYSFHMPAFFFAAGLFAARSLARGPARFLADKLRTVVYPYLLWSALFILALLAFPVGNARYEPALWGQIFSAPVGNYWFLYVLFAVQMLYLLVRPRRRGPLLFYLLALACWFVESAGLLDAALPAATFWAWHNVLKYAVYFALGDFVALASDAEESPDGSLLWTAVFFSLMTAILALGAGPDNRWVDLPLALAGIQGLWELSVVLSRRPLGWLTTLGRRSLEIFLAHNFFSVAARVALTRAGVGETEVHFLAGTLAGLLGPLGLVWLCDRLRFRWLFTAGR
jgi:fucose 4-O-acetylase-like acetyltransferase